MKGKRGLRTALTAALAAVFLFSLGMMAVRARQERMSEEADLEAAALVGLPELPEPPAAVSAAPSPVESGGAEETPVSQESPEPETTLPPAREDPYTQALKDMDFQALQEINPDVVGWFLIPGTGISYPLLQGESNNTYLRHTWRKEYSTRGSIFLDSQCGRDLTDFNTIVYGHRMRNGTMFAPLANYGQESYRQAHPCVYIVTEAGTFRYEIFAVYEADTSASAYRLGMDTEKARQEFLDDCLARSFLNTGLKPTPVDRVLTLSTCTPAGNNQRLVVQAVLWGERPEEGAPAESVPEEGEVLLPPEAESLPEGGPVEPPAE